MATTELASPLIGGQAGVANKSGSAAIEGEAFAKFTAQADHGVRFDIGLGALVGLNASFSKFVSASAQGEAHAELNATVQIQVPMNLFEEVGAAVRLRISAEAAAGVTLSLGLNVGDFISLVESQVGTNTLESRLFLIFLEEVTIGGGVYAKAAAWRWRTRRLLSPVARSKARIRARIRASASSPKRARGSRRVQASACSSRRASTTSALCRPLD